MKYAFSNEQMRRADAATIAAGTPSLELMERAGQALARAVAEAMSKKGASDALFVCGGGNNGGDGFAAARILADAGEDVSVLCLAEKFSPDCAAMRERYKGETLGRIPRRRYGVIVDCLFGTGLARPIEGINKTLVDFINGSGAYVIACDLPSGLGECGIAPEVCVRADETVAMGQMKQALLMADGADFAGTVTVAQIGIHAEERGAEVWEASDVKQLFPPRRSNTHKGRGKIIKTMPDGGSTAGWKFEVYDSDNELVGSYTTASDGTVLTDYLLPGTYTVKEIILENSPYTCDAPNPKTVSSCSCEKRVFTLN